MLCISNSGELERRALSVPAVASTRMSNNPLSVTPDTDISEWQCPYCNQTRQTLSDIRKHITESTDGEHQGVDGLKPTQDIIAYGPDGEEVELIEGVSTEPADPIEDYDKRELIINAWVAADRDPDQEAVEDVTGTSQQYVSRLITELESGEIPRDAWIDVLDYGLVDELRDRLEDHDPAENTEETTMSAQVTVEDVIEESTKKDRILALHEVSPNIDKKAAADALDVSYEYVRQIFNDIEDRDKEDWQKLREGDLDEALSPELLDAVETRLREESVLADTESEAEEETSDQPTRSRSASTDGVVPVEDVLDVRARMELLLEQAEYTGGSEAEFVAIKGVEWLDELIDDAE